MEKGQRTAAALGGCTDYSDSRTAVLGAYSSVTETYRRFCDLWQKHGESYLDVWRKQKVSLDQWLYFCVACTDLKLKT